MFFEDLLHSYTRVVYPANRVFESTGSPSFRGSMLGARSPLDHSQGISAGPELQTLYPWSLACLVRVRASKHKALQGRAKADLAGLRKVTPGALSLFCRIGFRGVGV